jgi:hypothetical protein
MVSGARGLMFKQALNASEGSSMDKKKSQLKFQSADRIDEFVTFGD